MIRYLPDIEGLLVYNIQGKMFKAVHNADISFHWGRLMAYQKGKDLSVLGMVHVF